MSENRARPVSKQAAYDTIKAAIVKSEPQISKRLPAILTSERMISDVLTSLQRTPKLLLCSPLSILGTVIQASEIGLRLNGFLGEAYMVPFWNGHTKQLEAQMQAGYRGLITLARRSGEVTKIESRLVFHFDTHFKMFYGTSPKIEHEPNDAHPDYMRREEGTADLVGLRGAYAVCTYKDGSDFEFCNLVRLQELRARSQARDREDNEVGPWTTDPAEMYRKVPIRQLAKRLPLSTDDGRFQRAATLDEYGDMGVAQGNAAIIAADTDFENVLSTQVRAQADELAAKHLTHRAPAPAAPERKPPAKGFVATRIKNQQQARQPHA